MSYTKEERNKYAKQYFLKNKEKIREYKRKYYREYCLKYPERINLSKKRYRETHKETIRIYARKYNIKEKEKIEKNPQIKLDKNISKTIWLALKRKKCGIEWQTLVGYKKTDLIKHLEGKFDEKMSWNNYGRYWHLDHIKPKSLFKYETAENPEFKKCWALENLQPLEKIANIKKKDYYIG